MDEILISCIIPTFNRALLLKDAIESILLQTYQCWELIIVDDNSTDNTKELVTSYKQKDSRISYLFNPVKGGNAARNLGIKLAKGKYIAFLDDDDISLPNRFSSQLKAIEYGKSGFVVSYFEARHRTDNRSYINNKTPQVTLTGFPSRWMIRRDLLIQAGLFDPDFPSMQDLEISCRLSLLTRYEYHPVVVSIIYYTENSVSRKQNSSAGLKMLLEKHFKNLKPEEVSLGYWRLAKSDLVILNNKISAKENLKRADEFASSGFLFLPRLILRLLLIITVGKKILHWIDRHPPVNFHVKHEILPSFFD